MPKTAFKTFQNSLPKDTSISEESGAHRIFNEIELQSPEKIKQKIHFPLRFAHCLRFLASDCLSHIWLMIQKRSVFEQNVDIHSNIQRGTLRMELQFFFYSQFCIFQRPFAGKDNPDIFLQRRKYCSGNKNSRKYMEQNFLQSKPFTICLLYYTYVQAESWLVLVSSTLCSKKCDF